VKIQIDARHCGAGKSTNIIQIINSSNEKFLLVVPTTALQEQYSNAISNIKVINSNNSPENATKSLVGVLKAKKHRVVCITHELFKSFTFNPTQKSEYHLVIDEVFNPIEFIVADELISAMSQAAIDSIKSKKVGQVIELESQNIIQDSLSNQKLVSALADKDKKVFFKQNSNLGSHVLTQILPSKLNFKSCYVAGANCEKSLLLANQDLEYAIINGNPAMFKGHNFTRAAIHVIGDAQSLTKGKHITQKSFKKFMVAVKKEVKRTACLLLANNCLEISERDSETFTRISHSSHGINSYSYINNIALYSATNLDNGSMSILKEILGVSGEYIKEATTFQTYYQAVMRTNLRVGDSSKPVKIFVADANVADFLKKILN
jgi:hypothetical protein